MGLAAILRMARGPRSSRPSARRATGGPRTRKRRETIAFGNGLGSAMVRSPVLYEEYQAMSDFHGTATASQRHTVPRQAIDTGRAKDSRMSLGAKSYYAYRRGVKALRLFGAIAGPGIIVMVADNDAGGITTYTATGAKYGLYLLWFLVLLGPVAYYVQEMTVRLGAVTKRGHAEAIFSAFGRFWGWFSLLDLVMTDWLTMITEFIGMTAAMSIFGLPPWLTVLGCWLIMGGMILSGRYWTWEKIALLAGTVVLIPNAPLVLITLFVQVIATTLLPAALVFLILLLNDKKTMGGYVNTTWENIVNISIVIAIIVMWTLYGTTRVSQDRYGPGRCVLGHAGRAVGPRGPHGAWASDARAPRGPVGSPRRRPVVVQAHHRRSGATVDERHRPHPGPRDVPCPQRSRRQNLGRSPRRGLAAFWARTRLCAFLPSHQGPGPGSQPQVCQARNRDHALRQDLPGGLAGLPGPAGGPDGVQVHEQCILWIRPEATCIRLFYLKKRPWISFLC